jgi:hypothetical protein
LSKLVLDILVNGKLDQERANRSKYGKHHSHQNG